jgi:hypothetical protein
MTPRFLRGAIVVLTLATAIVHGIVLNIRMGRLDPAFTANGIGYLVLLGLFLFRPSFLAGKERWLYYAFMAFAVVTIIAYFAISGSAFSDVLGLVTKAIEVALVIALWQHLRLTQPA